MKKTKTDTCTNTKTMTETKTLKIVDCRIHLFFLKIVDEKFDFFDIDKDKNISSNLVT